MTNEAELLLYGDIGNYEGWNDVTAKEFARDLAALGDVDTINLRINSVGGDVFAGQAIHSILKRHKATVNVYVDGLAASIASVVAMAGDNIYMPKNTMMMIHHPWGVRQGNARELRKYAEDMEKIAETAIVLYMEKTGQPREKIIEIMDGETWLTAEECVELGFATQVIPAIETNACLKGQTLFYAGQTFDMSGFKKLPNLQQSTAKEPPKQKGIQKQGDRSVEEITLEFLQKNHPDVYASAKRAGFEEGVQKERERMQALDALSAPGCEKIIEEARYKTGATAQEIALDIVMELKKGAPIGTLSNMMADGQPISTIHAAADASQRETKEKEELEFVQKTVAAVNRQRGAK